MRRLLLHDERMQCSERARARGFEIEYCQAE